MEAYMIISICIKPFECDCFCCSPSCAWEIRRWSRLFNIIRWCLLKDCEWTWVQMIQPMVPRSKCGQSAWKPKKACVHHASVFINIIFVVNVNDAFIVHDMFFIFTCLAIWGQLFASILSWQWNACFVYIPY